MTDRPLVVFSERLGPLGPTEDLLVQAGVDIHSRPMWTEQQIVDACAGARVAVFGAAEPVTARVLAELTSVELVVRRGIGTDNVDLGAATALGLPVAYAPDASVEEVSDHALALALTVLRRAPFVDAAVRSDDLAPAVRLVERVRRFADTTLGIVGIGRIGSALARKAVPLFGCVLVHDPRAVAAGAAVPDGTSHVDLPSLLADSHVVSLHVPSTPETRGMIGAELLDLLPTGACLVNTARGELVDEDALIAALSSGRLSAALDVTREEPLPADSPLRSAPNLLLTGHTAAKGARSSTTLRESVVEAVLAAFRGQAPPHVANADVLDSPALRLRRSQEDR